MPTPRWYEVLSPEYVMRDGDGIDPPEWGRDWLPVQATTKRRAKVLAVRAWRRRGNTYVADDPSANPFTELTVRPMDPCPHGVLVCLPCSLCEAAWMEELETSIAELSA